jgi:H+/gluconate symporter-like permease
VHVKLGEPFQMLREFAAVATNLLAALTGSASGGLTIALDALGSTYTRLAVEHGIDPALLHRIAVMSAGTLDSSPQNGAVVTLLAVWIDASGELL